MSGPLMIPPLEKNTIEGTDFRFCGRQHGRRAYLVKNDTLFWRKAGVLKSRPFGNAVLLSSDGAFTDRDEKRLDLAEGKLDHLLGSSMFTHPSPHPTPQNHWHQQQPFDVRLEWAANESSISHLSPQKLREPGYLNTHILVVPASRYPAVRPSAAQISIGISFYFEYCHRQPIWCFEREDVGDYDSLNDELACSIVALTLRFSDNRDGKPLYSSNAGSLIMLRIASETVDIATLESLCLLSYSSFIDGNALTGQFHLGLAVQLCRSAMLDVESAHGVEDPMPERKRRLFWSLHILEQFYGRQEGLLRIPIGIWRSSFLTTRVQSPADEHRAINLPKDELGCQKSCELGIWNLSIHLGWVWSQVRKYISDCAHDIIQEPWRHDSAYNKVQAELMEIENRIPICHCYDTVRFFERKVGDLKAHRDYWSPWLKEQFTYHVILTVLNHPLLYTVGLQRNPNLAVPNTFWKRASELALFHSTWIVRMIDMVIDKRVPLVDPFVGHAAAISATVHLYYCCATTPALRHKSNTDFAKSRRFLKGFILTSSACRALDRDLDEMTRIAAGSETLAIEAWMPSKIYLSVPLMWRILRFDAAVNLHENPGAGLLDSTLVPRPAEDDPYDNCVLEITAASTPEISIDVANGGQVALTLSSSHNFETA
ncbi:related to C6 transcription factor [Fusarium mangiferae]|uniref:Related to C6 transcription factor n=1 Tax=Fusarium mangiferae TaxID=192010 RepID=A0A1L7UNT4_FUSMA|nr:uncharacterized protein FMAN_15439 [Fusarium mangiferae]CVL09171.1 related to C6 transcription factor [Fusarium mangiferae]